MPLALAVDHDLAVTRATRLLRTSRQLCTEAGTLIGATRALRAQSFSVRRMLTVPAIRGGADGLEADAPAGAHRRPPAGLPETSFHRCPTCDGSDVAFQNTVWAGTGVVRLKYSCQECHQQFWFVRPDRPSI